MRTRLVIAAVHRDNTAGETTGDQAGGQSAGDEHAWLAARERPHLVQQLSGFASSSQDATECARVPASETRSVACPRCSLRSAIEFSSSPSDAQVADQVAVLCRGLLAQLVLRLPDDVAGLGLRLLSDVLRALARGLGDLPGRLLTGLGRVCGLVLGRRRAVIVRADLRIGVRTRPGRTCRGTARGVGERPRLQIRRAGIRRWRRMRRYRSQRVTGFGHAASFVWDDPASTVHAESHCCGGRRGLISKSARCWTVAYT